MRIKDETKSDAAIAAAGPGRKYSIYYYVALISH